MTDLTKTIMFACALSMSTSFAMAQDNAAPPAAGDAAQSEAPADAGTTSGADATTTPEGTDATTPADTTATGDAAQADGAQKPADGPGTTYVASTHGDWAVQCVRTEDGSDPCQMYQLLKDQTGNNIADISLFPLPDGNKAAAGATIMVPLETLLTKNMMIKVDSSEPKAYPFTFCAQAGCFSRVGLTKEELAQYKRGSKATMSIVPVAAPDQRVDVNISLSGFTAAYDEVTKANASADK